MHAIERIKNHDLGLFVLRLVVGLVFVAHGWDKFMNIDQTVRFFGSLDLPVFVAYLVAAVEFLGGLALILGAWTTTAGFALAIIMVGAILLVKMGRGFLGGYEFELTLLAASLAIALLGAGKYRAFKR